MTYFCTVHRDDARVCNGKALDAMTSHMVFDDGYSMEDMRDIVLHHPQKVIFQMAKDASAKFGYRFDGLVGIPA